MPELQDRLQAALGAGYRVETELGGGGMSRVFLAEEVRLGRRVVVKVLPPEMAAGVSVDRFEREIQLAAKLQHPHIVALLSAGSSDDLLYYVMPFIEGESLRAKLAREGELPVPEALRILRDVLDALAYAHRRQVIHRDIKPDNVLLSEGHALVTDFGVAKAVAESTGKHTLTSMGVALGTPAYMAPEQAVADPHVDHRADIYAVGVLAYEMLSGRLPFAASTPQAMLAAHVTEAPDPVTRHRTAVPEALNQVILRCLEKKPADRWQRAEDLRSQVEVLLTPTGGTTPTGTQPVISAGTQAAIDRAHPLRVAALFALASVGVLAIVYLLVRLIGLPDWVFYGAVALLVVGLPIMLLTGHQERRRALGRSSVGATAMPPGGIQRWFTWRTALLGGGVAFGGLGLVSAGYMAMRALGIGPVGTLVASGVLKQRDRLVLADFANRTGDSTLGPSVTELLRVGLAQSPIVSVMEPNKVNEVLARMERKPGTRIDPSLAMEIAQREGLKGIVTGSVVAVGTGFALSAQLLRADGQELTVQQESAPDANGLIAAVGRLSGKLRERIGESLRHIRAERLEQVTTGSLQALRLYTQALSVENAGNSSRAIELLEEAVRVDTAFAMAYRKLGVILGNNFERRARALEVITRAYDHRDRLTEVERYQAIAFYHMRVTGELQNALSAYQTLLDLHPNDGTALNNIGVVYEQLLDGANAEKYYRRALELDSSLTIYYGNVIDAQVLQGKLSDAEATLERYAAHFPGNPRVAAHRMRLAINRRDYAAADQNLRDVPLTPGDLLLRANVSEARAQLAALRGKMGEAERHWADALEAQEQRHAAGQFLSTASGLALGQALVGGDPVRAARTLDQALKRHPLESLTLLDRPMLDLAGAYAFAGRPERARVLLTQFQQSGVTRLDPEAAHRYHQTRALLALAEHRPNEVLAAMQEFGRDLCLQCALSPLARAYDMAGETDSAVAYYERYINTPWNYRLFMDATELPAFYRRLGELYEQKGSREKAVEYYAKLVELWKDADPELQPVVRDVKQRMARLAGEPTR